MSIAPIPTWYAGRKFRSRLEARWAVFFDAAGIRWQYESEGYLIKCPITSTVTPYLPDFLLPDCGTWIEVKGAEKALNRPLLINAAAQLPQEPVHGELGPALLVLGPFPNKIPWLYDWGWVAPINLNPDPMPDPWPDDWIRCSVGDTARYGFGSYHKNNRPWYLDNATSSQYRHPMSKDSNGEWVVEACPGDHWLEPIVDSSEELDTRVRDAYRAAQSARFEHGENGAVL